MLILRNNPLQQEKKNKKKKKKEKKKKKKKKKELEKQDIYEPIIDDTVFRTEVKRPYYLACTKERQNA